VGLELTDSLAESKPRWSLMPWRALLQVSRAMTLGAAKHGDLSYRAADADAYFDAAMRHLTAWRCGETADPETGLHPLAHAAADVLIGLEICLNPSTTSPD
jgi:hypothetical protein